MLSVAVISAHGSPLAKLGGRETGGMNVYIRESSRELSRRGVRLDIYTRWQDPSLPQVLEFAEHARVIHLKAGLLGRMDKNKVYYHLPEFLHNLRHFREEQGLAYDVLHSHYWLSGWVACRLQQRWQVPHVAMFHTLGLVKNKARAGEKESALRIEAERRVIASADRLVAATEHERVLMQRLYGAAVPKIEIVPCGVDLDLFRPLDRQAARGALGLRDHQKVVLFVGRIEPLKGLDILIRAVADLEDRANVCLMVVGGDGGRDRELARLRGVARSLGVAEQVCFLGSLEHSALPQIYAAADVCVIPSYYESFGMVALEAMACGRPVIASRVGGLQSTVKDGETGFLIPWRCPEPFAERLEVLLGNDRLRAQFGKAARAAAERYSWDAICDSLLAVYADMIKTFPSTPHQSGCGKMPGTWADAHPARSGKTGGAA